MKGFMHSVSTLAIGLAGLMAAAATVEAQQTEEEMAFHRRQRTQRNYYQDPGAQGAAEAAPAPAGPAKPAAKAPAVAPAPAPAPQAETPPAAENATPPGTGEQFASAATSFSPNMIGDSSFASSGGFITLSSFGTSIPIAGADRLFKISENNSPIPTNRFFFNYNHFQNAAWGWNNQAWDIDRSVFGFEKTFLHGWGSFELRLPIANGLDSDQHLGIPGTISGTEFGDIPLVFKGLLWRGPKLAVSMGVALVLPTAKDGRVFLDDDPDVAVLVDNRSLHIQPFVGWAWEGNRCFFKFFSAIDVAASGNDVYARDFNTDELVKLGTYQDQTLAFFDFKWGYWLYRNPCACLLTGVVPTVELHYTTTLQDTDVVSDPSGFVNVSNINNRMDILNLTTGVQFMLGSLSDLTLAAAVPLKGQGNRQYDAEILVQFNRRF
jgi:hypothetical protein